MNNKGFTLVELLAIVVIISVIATVAVPSITNEIDSSDKHTQNVVDESIENAAKLYVAKYYAKKFIEKKEIKFTLNDLENDGLLNLKSDICKDDKDKVIRVLNPDYNYNELSESCYSKSKRDETGIAPTPTTTPSSSPTPTTTPTTSPSPTTTSDSAKEKISISEIKKKDSYESQNEQIFRRAMHYIIYEEKVENGKFDGKFPFCDNNNYDDVMCYHPTNQLQVNVKNLIFYYSNKKFGDRNNVNENLYNDGYTRVFSIIYNRENNSYSMGLCDRQTGSYYGYQYVATYSTKDGFNFKKEVTENNECSPMIEFYCCYNKEICYKDDRDLTFPIRDKVTCSANKKGVKISLEKGEGRIIKTGSYSNQSRYSKQFKFDTPGTKIISFEYGGLKETKTITIRK